MNTQQIAYAKEVAKMQKYFNNELEKAKAEQEKAYEEEKARLRWECNNLVPEIYACFCKVLIEDYGKSDDEVNTLFIRTQEVWNELVNKEEISDMISWCEKTTGMILSERREDCENG